MVLIAALQFVLKAFALLLAGLLLGKAIWTALFYVSGSAIIANRDREDSSRRLSYLLARTLDKSFHVKKMSSYLSDSFKGEWALVTYSMTAAAIANLAFTHPESQIGASERIGDLIEAVLLPEFRAFDKAYWGQDAIESLDGPEGHIGYLGHLNFMLAAYHLVGGQQERYRQLFERVSLHLRRAIEESPFLSAETYPGQIYLPDNAVVIASLALFERITTGSEGSIADRWLQHGRDHLCDPETGLLVFRLSRSGLPMQSSRGSGSAWSIFYLSYFSAEEAVRQYWLLKQHFSKWVIPGIGGICEWPHCQDRAGDIDSGPLILGLSPSATGFAIAGAKLAHDVHFLSTLSLTAELVGSSVQTRGQRRYFVAERIAPLIGDAILLAMKTVTAWDGRYLPH